MKKKLFAFIITVLLICIEAYCVYASDAPRAVKNAAKSAVELSVNTSFGTKTVTAFAVNKGNKTKYLVTNLWAIEGYTGDIIVNSGNDETITATVIATDEVKNIAVLQLSDEPDGVKNIKIKVKDAPVRWIDIDGVGNVRDMGGWKTASGKTVKYGMLYRGRRLEDVSEEGIATIKRLGLKTELDLRYADQKFQTPGTGMNYQFIETPGQYDSVLKNEPVIFKASYKKIFELLSKFDIKLSLVFSSSN